MPRPGIALILALLALAGRSAALRLPWLRPGGTDDWVREGELIPPSWPDSYSTTYIFSLPYTAQVQPNVVNYTVTFHRDAPADAAPRIRMDTLDSANVLIASADVEYELVPRLDRQVCRINRDIAPGEGNNVLTALPDITGWAFGGDAHVINGREAVLWQYNARHEAKTVLYRFFVASDGSPLRLHMHGNEISTGAHFDEWVADFVDFKAGSPDSAVFDRPEICEEERRGDTVPAGAAAARARAALPLVRYGGGDAGYDAFLSSEHGRGRAHTSLAEYRLRVGVFRKNAAMIAAHNAANRSYTMAMNRFGDWTREEFAALMLPKRAHRQASAVASTASASDKKELDRHEVPYEALADPSKLPAAVDWRGTGADVGVKDQANCGSCWAFGAVGAMESAWFAATGRSARFSEQQVMDCAWGYVPEREDAAAACDGGEAWAGVGHIVDAGGIAAAEDYQYRGQDDYCREPSPGEHSLTTGGNGNGGGGGARTGVVGKFKGFARIPSGDDAALMEAVYSRGPLAVSMDASQDSFTFYSSGVYYDTACMWKYDDLDHSMVLVGYGTDPEGDYWLVKNSWSTNWGDNGYFKVARDGHGCGAATDAIYAVVDQDAAAVAARK